ncbi:MAG TPA: SRPBCC domain-containing protein [Polyangiaceae bacterium]|nr:SRPBCC domain-containing protein [Polyangiaceae bacterium]
MNRAANETSAKISTPSDREIRTERIFNAPRVEGRYREVVAPEGVVQTFEWDGMPGHVVVETMTLEDLGDGRTKLVTVSLFHTTMERDGMLHSGMEEGMNQSYAALDKLLASLGGSTR